jgi:hypothetical protein
MLEVQNCYKVKPIQKELSVKVIKLKRKNLNKHEWFSIIQKFKDKKFNHGNPVDNQENPNAGIALTKIAHKMAT